jgi:hypothetical protein
MPPINPNYSFTYSPPNADNPPNVSFQATWLNPPNTSYAPGAPAPLFGYGSYLPVPPPFQPAPFSTHPYPAPTALAAPTSFLSAYPLPPAPPAAFALFQALSSPPSSSLPNTQVITLEASTLSGSLLNSLSPASVTSTHELFQTIHPTNPLAKKIALASDEPSSETRLFHAQSDAIPQASAASDQFSDAASEASTLDLTDYLNAYRPKSKQPEKEPTLKRKAPSKASSSSSKSDKEPTSSDFKPDVKSEMLMYYMQHEQRANIKHLEATLNTSDEKKLNLANCNITTLPPFMPTLFSQLTDLSLFSNTLKTVPPTICELANLQVLDLSACSLSQVPGLEKLTKLATLNLSNNLLRALPKFESSSLTHLNLSQNAISHFPDLSALEALSDLDLSKNQVEHLYAKEASHLPESLINIDLSENPLQSLSKVFAAKKIKTDSTPYYRSILKKNQK